jgi:hypothetical protein
MMAATQGRRCGWARLVGLSCPPYRPSHEVSINQGRSAMILGMSTAAFTQLHVVISLIGIASGLVVLFGMFGSKRLKGWTALFLATTILTSVTGFFFPLTKIGPPLVVGAS